jgi:hypothetical protein
MSNSKAKYEIEKTFFYLYGHKKVMSRKTASIRSPPSKGTSSEEELRLFPAPPPLPELFLPLTMIAPSFGSGLSELKNQ